MNRRQFLSHLLASSRGLAAMGMVGGTVLSACSSMDRIFSVEKTEFDNEVIIIGGGPAGLAAALNCKKRKIPYTIFEASTHLGGRVRAVHVKNEAEPLALDLGLTTIEERHRTVFDLCRELNLELTERNASSRWDQALYVDNGKLVPLQKNRTELEKVFSVVAEAQIKNLGDRKDGDWPESVFMQAEVVALDQMSFKEFLQKKNIKLSPLVEDFLQGFCRANWGQDMSEVSALAVILHLDPENRGPTQFVLRGGFGGLTQTMFERSAGVLTNHLVKSGHQLVEVEQKGGDFHLTFQVQNLQGVPTTSTTAANGNLVPRWKYIRCKRLIVAVPVSQLAQIRWSGDLRLAMEPWNTKAHGFLTGQTRSYHMGPSKQFKNRWAVGKDKLLQIEGMGEEGNIISVLSKPGTITPEGTGFPTSLGYAAPPLAYMDWSQQANIKGARWSQGPGVLTNYQKWKQEFKTPGKIYFAGEFDSTTFPGTLEGALASGIKAATVVAPQSELIGSS